MLTIRSAITPAITTAQRKVIRNNPPNTLPVREKFRRSVGKIPRDSLTLTGTIRVNNEAISKPGTKKQLEPIITGTPTTSAYTSAEGRKRSRSEEHTSELQSRLH